MRKKKKTNTSWTKLCTRSTTRRANNYKNDDKSYNLDTIGLRSFGFYNLQWIQIFRKKKGAKEGKNLSVRTL